MKSKKIIKGLMVIGALVGLAAPMIANADTGGPAESYDSKSVTLKGFEDYDTVSVDVEWGDLEFEYSENRWNALPTSYDDYLDSNFIKVTNKSRRPLHAGAWFTPNIYGLDAYIDVFTSREGFGSCVGARNKILYSNAWSEDRQNGGYVYKTNPSDVIIYEDGNCELQVANGTKYDSNKTDYYVQLYGEYAGSSYEDGADVIIPGTISEYADVVGSQYNPSSLASTATFFMDLAGGDYSEIQHTFNNNKRIGTLNIWLYSIGD